MLANRMSNQDEVEVEDELAALEAEMLPEPPTRIELSEEQKAELAKERARRLQRERAAEQATTEQAAEPMLA